MQTRHHLIAFAAGANTDPITPAFDPRLAIQRITLLHSPSETSRAEWLAEVLRDGGKQVEARQLPKLSSFAGLRQSIGPLLACHPDAIVNLSGCDAARAALALQAATAIDLPVCVVSPETDRLHWLRAPAHFVGFDVADRITLDGFLAAHGYTRVDAGACLGDAPDLLDEVASHLATSCFGNPRLIESFRTTLQLQGDTSTRPADRGTMRNLADYLQRRGLVEILPDRHLRVARPEHRAFLSGGWLERWLFREVVELAGPGTLQDAAQGLKISTDSGVENELDLAVLRDNALYFAECKGFARPGIGNETLFKLHSLSEQRGLHARGLILSTRAPTTAEALRARNLSIVVIGSDATGNLRQSLREWLQLD